MDKKKGTTGTTKRKKHFCPKCGAYKKKDGRDNCIKCGFQGKPSDFVHITR